MILQINPRRTDRCGKYEAPGCEKKPLDQGGGRMGVARVGRMSEEEEES